LVQTDKTRVAVRINCPAAVAPGFRTEPDRHQAYGVDAGDEPASGRHGTEHADQHCGCHRSARHHNPPSFYAAFGNKAGLYARILGRYAGTDAISLADLLRSDRPMAECLAAVLEEAARRYAADPAAAGCLVLEGVRCNDPEAREAARVFHAAAEDVVRRYIAARHPEEAERLTDFVSTTMAGLSAKSRNGYGLDRLLATARLASLAVAQALPA
jgi:TetR/AcrR family transcriptional regulator, repressor for divergent bdcA